MVDTIAVKGKTRTLDGLKFAEIDFDELIKSGRPCILKGALNNSALVVAGKSSNKEAMKHLLSYTSDRPVLNYVADAQAKGRFFYNQKMSGLNFTTEYSSMAEFFEKLEAQITEKSGSSYYIGSANAAEHFPNFLDDDGLQLTAGIFEEHPPRVGIWLGNRTTAVTHFDMSNNIAACMVGRRRFTLFPPDQIENLYPGPFEPTPGGQVLSMFDLNAPDFKQFPKARIALEHGEIAELEAGDVLVYPAMWWHQVEALDNFNVLLNYWWNSVPTYIDDPMNTLLHGLLSLRDRPEHEKEAWRKLFDFYIFGAPDNTRNHLPEHIWGALAPMNETISRRLRSRLLKKLNR